MMRIKISPDVARYGLPCLLFGTLSWGHMVIPAPAAQEPAPATNAIPAAPSANQNQQTETSNVAPDAAVITITGLCDNPPKDKAGISDCKTVITRTEFEKLVGAVQPNMKGRARREFATNYATALVMAKKAEKMGLDKGENFEEQMKVARIQVLAQELKRKIQSELSLISDTDIDNYYHENLPVFEEAEMERIYIPKAQDLPASPDKTLSEADKQKQLHRTELSMKEVADNLRARAVAGGDFNSLQADAYKIAGIKTTPSASLGKIRRISLPRSQVVVMDLKPGEVSSVIEAPNGYFIYKIRNKETLPLEKAREEIKGILRSQRLQDATRTIQESATPILDEAYFTPSRPPRGVTESGEPTQPSSNPHSKPD